MKKLLLLLSLTAVTLFAEVSMDKPLPSLTLEGDNGGHYAGEAWNSSMLKGKTTMLMYVDPDERSKGEVFKPTIAGFEKDLDFSKFQIVVVINLNATWKPNAVIRKMMKSKVDEHPKRIYVLDVNSAFVKSWGLMDDEYNTIVINDNGQVIYNHSGEWKGDEMDKINTLVRSTVK